MLQADARSLSQDAQEALRVRGVRLVVEEGWSQVAVAEAFGVDARVVRRWLKRFRDGGWAALAKQRRGRRADEQQALSAGQQERIAGLIVGHCPDQLQIPGLLWARASVQALIEREAGVRLETARSEIWVMRTGRIRRRRRHRTVARVAVDPPLKLFDASVASARRRSASASRGSISNGSCSRSRRWSSSTA